MAKLEIEKLETSGSTFDLGDGWQIGSSDEFIGLLSTNTIRNNADTQALSLAGGSSGLTGTGARILLHGQSHASFPDSLLLSAGSGVGDIDFYSGGTHVWRIADTGQLYGMSTTENTIGCFTSDGSDTSRLVLAPSGTGTSSRGGYIRLHGNEHASLPGKIDIVAGTAANNEIRFYTNGSERWNIPSTGHFVPSSDAVLDIGTNDFRIRDIYIETWSEYRGSTSSNEWQVGCGGASTTLLAQTNSTGTRTFSVTNAGSGSSRILVDGVQVNVPFTAYHVYEKGSSDPQVGDAVKLVNRKLEKCDSDSDKSCIGIMTSDSVTTAANGDMPEQEAITDSFGQTFVHAVGGPHILYCVASLGDSKTDGLPGVKVCDDAGAISAGDLLETCASKPGFLRKQADDIIRASTVAQAIEDVVFDENSNTEASSVYVYLKN